MGKAEVKVEAVDGTVTTLPLIVVEGKGPSLLGRNWLRHVRFDWQSIAYLEPASQGHELKRILSHHKAVFSEGLGKLRGTTVKLHVNQEATPQFYRARPVPHALREKIEEELVRLQRTGVIEQVQYSDWAAPVVPIVKPGETYDCVEIIN